MRTREIAESIGRRVNHDDAVTLDLDVWEDGRFAYDDDDLQILAPRLRRRLGCMIVTLHRGNETVESRRKL